MKRSNVKERRPCKTQVAGTLQFLLDKKEMVLQRNAALNSLAFWGHPAWSNHSEDLTHVAAVSQWVKYHRIQLALQRSTVADIVYGVKGCIPDSKLAQYGDFRYDLDTEDMFVPDDESHMSEPTSKGSSLPDDPNTSQGPKKDAPESEELPFHPNVNRLMDDLTEAMYKPKVDAKMDEWFKMLESLLNDMKCFVFEKGVQLDKWTKTLLSTCVQFTSAARVNVDLGRLMETEIPFVINFEQLSSELVSREELLSVTQPHLPTDDIPSHVQEGRLWIKLSSPDVRRHWTSDERSTMFGNVPPAIGEALGWTSNVVGVTNFLRRSPFRNSSGNRSCHPETDDEEIPKDTLQILLGSLLDYIDNYDFDAARNATLDETPEDFAQSPTKNTFPEAHGKWISDLFPHRFPSDTHQDQAKPTTEAEEIEPDDFCQDPSKNLSPIGAERDLRKPEGSKDPPTLPSTWQTMNSMPLPAAVRLRNVFPCPRPGETGPYLPFTQFTVQPAVWLSPPQVRGYAHHPFRDHLPYYICHPPPTHPSFRSHVFEQNCPGNPHLPMSQQHLQNVIFSNERFMANNSMNNFANHPTMSSYRMKVFASSPRHTYVDARGNFYQQQVVKNRRDKNENLHKTREFRRNSSASLSRGTSNLLLNWRDNSQSMHRDGENKTSFETCAKTQDSTTKAASQLVTKDDNSGAVNTSMNQRLDSNTSQNICHSGGFRTACQNPAKVQDSNTIPNSQLVAKNDNSGSENVCRNQQLDINTSQNTCHSSEFKTAYQLSDKVQDSNIKVDSQLVAKDCSGIVSPSINLKLKVQNEGADKKAQLNDESINLQQNKCLYEKPHQLQSMTSNSKVSLYPELDMNDNFELEISPPEDKQNGNMESVNPSTCDSVNIEKIEQPKWQTIPDTGMKKTEAWFTEGSKKIVWSQHFKNGFGTKQVVSNAPMLFETRTSSLIKKAGKATKYSGPCVQSMKRRTNKPLIWKSEHEFQWPKPSTPSKPGVKKQFIQAERYRKHKKLKYKKEFCRYLDEMVGSFESFCTQRLSQARKLSLEQVSEGKNINENNSAAPAALQPVDKSDSMFLNDESELHNDVKEMDNMDSAKNEFSFEGIDNVCSDEKIKICLSDVSDSFCEDTDYFADEENTQLFDSNLKNNSRLNKLNFKFDTNINFSPSKEALNITNQMFENKKFKNRNLKERAGKNYGVLSYMYKNKVNGWTHFRTVIQTVTENVLQSIIDVENKNKSDIQLSR